MTAREVRGAGRRVGGGRVCDDCVTEDENDDTDAADCIIDSTLNADLVGRGE